MLTVSPENAGTVTGSGRYDCNDIAIISAIPNDCYIFINWTDAETGEVISENLSDEILMQKNRKLIANFENYSYNILLSSMFYRAEIPLHDGYSQELNETPPKLRFSLSSDAPPAELNKFTELNISVDYSNVFARVLPNSLRLLDIGSDWSVTNSANINNYETLISNYSVTLSNSAGLASINNREIFEVDLQLAVPSKGMVENILPEHYNLHIFSSLTVRGTHCFLITSDTSILRISPICVIEYKMLDISDVDFDLQIIDNVINYSVGFDCDASLTIYNSLGQVILVPFSGAINKGHYTFDINGIDFSTGSYFCELQINGVYRKVVGMIITK